MNRSTSFVLCAAIAALSFAAAAEPTATVRVKAIEVQERTVPLVDEVVGTVTARNKPMVSAQINGTVLKTYAETGQRVKAGDLLAELTSSEADARLSGAKSSLDLATREFNRSQQLVASGTISKEAHDQATAALESAKAAVKEAQTAVGYKQVHSPINGVIRARRADAGEVTSPGKPLFEMEDEHSLRFEANVAESLSGGLAVGTAVPVRLDATDKQVSGTLSEITPSADPVSRTFLVRFDIAETSGVMAGQFGRAMLPAGKTTEVQVPTGAVLRRGQMEMVYVLDNGTARLRLVRTGRKSGDQIQLLSGIEPGERIAASGVSALVDGQKVEVE